MTISKKILAEKILDSLHHKITLAEFVDWSEKSLMEDDFDEQDFATINDIISAMGLADVRAFGLLWEDYENYLKKFGYKVKIQVEGGLEILSVHQNYPVFGLIILPKKRIVFVLFSFIKKIKG